MKTLFWILAIFTLMPLTGFTAYREIVVYSFLTDEGRTFPPPRSEPPVRCRLGSGGYHEWGGSRAGEKPMKLREIDPWIRRAPRVNSFEPLRVDEAADIIVVFHWGCMRPDPGWGRKGLSFSPILNEPDMIDLIAGRVLETTRDGILRRAINDAAAEERYFLIVSAFEPSAYARNLNVLLWRTQISMPNPGVSQSQAFPVLAAAGAAFFGRETTVPKFVSIDVEKALKAAVESTAH